MEQHPKVTFLWDGGRDVGIFAPGDVIESATEQTLERTVAEIPNMVDEVILVDDGSSDETVAMARRLGLNTIADWGSV